MLLSDDSSNGSYVKHTVLRIHQSSQSNIVYKPSFFSVYLGFYIDIWGFSIEFVFYEVMYSEFSGEVPLRLCPVRWVIFSEFYSKFPL